MTALETTNLSTRSDPSSPWWHIDPTPALAAVGLGLVGLIAIFSATRGRDEENYVTFFIERQGMFLVVGVATLFFIIFFDYRWLLSVVHIVYMGTIGLLVAVLLIGVEANGAKSWFAFGTFRMQPSEFAKIGLIVALAALMSRRTDGPMTFYELGFAIGLALLPIALVVRQPDVGTAMVFLAITASMLLVGRAEAHHLIFLVAVSAVALGLLINSPLLEDYQKDRLESFIDPTATQASYNQQQAQIAIGNGGMTGTGFGEGTQTKAGLVPEQQTDFIFTVVGEEFGFAGGTVVLTLFGLLMWRLYRIARLAGDSFGGYLVTGVLAMIGFQMFQSIGMTMGIMPVTGIPLPFVSYGGSSALTSFIGVGLAISVHMRRFGAGIDAEVGQPVR